MSKCKQKIIKDNCTYTIEECNGYIVIDKEEEEAYYGSYFHTSFNTKLSLDELIEALQELKEQAHG